jgi:hypothetical protein
MSCFRQRRRPVVSAFAPSVRLGQCHQPTDMDLHPGTITFRPIYDFMHEKRWRMYPHAGRFVVLLARVTSRTNVRNSLVVTSLTTPSLLCTPSLERVDTRRLPVFSLERVTTPASKPAPRNPRRMSPCLGSGPRRAGVPSNQWIRSPLSWVSLGRFVARDGVGYRRQQSSHQGRAATTTPKPLVP